MNILKAELSIENLLSYGNEYKNNFSIQTDIPSEVQFTKKISLCSCSSSVSIAQKQQFIQNSTQNRLFACYLSCRSVKQKQAIFQQMKNHFRQLEMFHREDILAYTRIQESNQNQNSKILDHFIGSWLFHMGYNTKNHKNYFLHKIKIRKGGQRLSIYYKIYKDLSFYDHNKNQKLNFLLNVCIQGWEYFINQIIDYVDKGLKIQNNDSPKKIKFGHKRSATTKTKHQFYLFDQ